MKCLSFFIALLVFLNWSGPARSETDIYKLCVGTRTMHVQSQSYNYFSNLDEFAQISISTYWLLGYSAGISLRNPLCGKRISDCINSTSARQRLEILKKKAYDTPETWGADNYLAVYLLQSFAHPCLQGKIPLNKKK